MRLTLLEPRYLKISSDIGISSENVSKEESDGMWFFCPVCYLKNRGPEGTHMIIVWRPKIQPASNRSGPGRWELRGNGFEDMTLIGSDSNSIMCKGGCNAHFSIVDGEVIIHD
jgi:hypothetical protein